MTARPVWVLPSVDAGYRNACLSTMTKDIRSRTVVVDNTIDNVGVAASWNLGIDRMVETGAEWLILLSESMRFGPNGGADFEVQLKGAWTDSLFGWHMVAFHRTTLERVGRFDENFFAYCEDADFLIRLHLAGLPSPRENTLPHAWVDTDCHHMGTEHSIREGLVQVDLGASQRYYQAKWGCLQPGYLWTHPFNDPTCDWTYWPAPVAVE